MFTPLTSFLINLTILVQTMVLGILGGIVKGLKGGKPSQTDVTKVQPPILELEKHFLLDRTSVLLLG